MPIREAVIRTVIEIAVSYGLAVAFSAALKQYASKAAEAVDGSSGKESPAQRSFAWVLAESALLALERPAQVLLPLAALVHSLRTAALLLQMLLYRQDQFFARMPGVMASVVEQGLQLLCQLDQYALESAELSILLFGAWFLLNWKDKAVMLTLAQQNPESRRAVKLERLLIPLSGLMSWLIVCAATLSALQVVGINIKPLLALGGASGIAIGFGAQQTMQNIISGINLFLSRPFVVGDRVTLQTMSGGTVLTGYVERIDPMRTLFRNDRSLPVQIPNKALLDMMVVNESRIERTTVMSAFKAPRQYTTTITLRYEDLKKVPAILADIKIALDANPMINKSLPYGCGLGGLSDWSVNLGLMAHTTSAEATNYGGLQSKILLEVAAIIEKHGADFAYPTSTTHVPQLANLPDTAKQMLQAEA